MKPRPLPPKKPPAPRGRATAGDQPARRRHRRPLRRALGRGAARVTPRRRRRPPAAPARPRPLVRRLHRRPRSSWPTGWRACGVTTVAMESTGVYWIPLFELLEARGFEVFLVDPPAVAARAGPAQERRARLPVAPAAAQLRPACGARSGPAEQVVVLRELPAAAADAGRATPASTSSTCRRPWSR